MPLRPQVAEHRRDLFSERRTTTLLGMSRLAIDSQAHHMKTNPDIATIASLFSYNPNTGGLSRTVSRGGAPAGPINPRLNSCGYARVTINKRLCYVHHVAWVLMTGVWPTKEVDTINRSRSDNRWANLREATKSQNRMNASLNDRNTSGHKGVRWHKASGKWLAEVTADRKTHYLGVFTQLEEAVRVVQDAREKLHNFYAGAVK